MHLDRDTARPAASPPTGYGWARPADRRKRRVRRSLSSGRALRGAVGLTHLTGCVALHAFIVVVEHEACVTANFNAAFAVSLEAVFADEWTNAGRCRDGSTSAMGWLSIRAPACCLRRCSSHWQCGCFLCEPGALQLPMIILLRSLFDRINL